ncbi:hypothetical protein [Acetobacter sp.]|uniref:hypothetical protein n=1 Tax=Acetobacter sp. TaxID=440 RepID=UPI0025BD965C|nr:hypothetical protein [Acetobacter sp.]MCH4091432.1 hypothetical protein [Acetobacter sp.]MCI1299410.1 hypothetical protein [Acetobacter sp.]MCI1316586.1 hypothetical protein [Acetobacter sp.]
MPLHKSYVALTWTRPVPWAGFDTLSSDIDVAAQQSRTIRYQRDLIRQYVREVNGILEREVALLELEPDRATSESLATLEKLAQECPPNATFLSVDFTAAQGWRPQPALRKGLPPERCVALPPTPMIVDGMLFDPQGHFREWRMREKNHMQSKPEHRQTILRALDRQEGLSLRQQADLLNERHLQTHGGKLWTADNLRKFLTLSESTDISGP